MMCAVYNCYNKNDNSDKISYHSFPKDSAKLKIWILFCKRKDKFNIKTAKICSQHFLKEDYANFLQHEIGFADNLLLKKGAIPSVYKKSKPEVVALKNNRSSRMASRKSKEIISSLLAETSADAVVADEITFIDMDEINNVDTIQELNQKVQNLQVELDDLKRKMENMKCENVRLLDAELIYKDDIAALKIEVQKSEFHRLNMETKLLEICTPNQIKKIKIFTPNQRKKIKIFTPNQINRRYDVLHLHGKFEKKN